MGEIKGLLPTQRDESMKGCVECKYATQVKKIVIKTAIKNYA